MRSAPAWFVAVVFVVFVIDACGGLGTPCEDRGSEDECGPGQVCARVEGDLYCRDTCDDDGDCGPAEECKGVKDSDERACKPEDDPDDDDGGNGPPF